MSGTRAGGLKARQTNLKKYGKNFYLIVASNEICIPCVDSEDNDEYMLVRFKVPLGSKDECYDGYEMAKEYAMKCEEKAEKERLANEKKQRKIAKDKADREAKAKAKAENGNK